MTKKLFLIDTATHVVVPRESTQGFPSMAQIGAATMWDVTERGSLIGHPQATAVYTAMIAAAPEVESLEVGDIEDLKGWVERVDSGYMCNLPDEYVIEAVRKYLELMEKTK